MYLFHGTSEEEAIDIVNNGFQELKNLYLSEKCIEKFGSERRLMIGEEWPYFLGPVNFFSNEPHCVGLTYEERYGSDPLSFAKAKAANLMYVNKPDSYFHNKRLYNNKPGSLIVIDVPPKQYNDAVVTIHRPEDLEKYYPLGYIEEAEKIFAELEARKKDHPVGKCHITIRNPLVNNYIKFGIRILDGNQIVKKFNPKYQQKSKHRKKNFNSLVWNEVQLLAQMNTGKPFYRKYE